MIARESRQTGFVDAGTALANMPGAVPGRNRNVFRIADEIIMVEETTETSTSPSTFVTTQGQTIDAGTARGAPDVHIKPVPLLSAPQQVTLPLAIWEGVVEEIDWKSELFYALLTSKTGDFDEHRVEIPIIEVEHSDMDMLAPGAVFYLEQYQRNRRGGREQTQVLRFRRCITWTQRALDWIDGEAKLLDTILRPYVAEKEDA